MRDVILILGASSDIGSSLIQELGTEPLILAHYHHNKPLSQENVIPIACDLSKQEDLQKLIEEIQLHGCPNKIVHLASHRVSHKRFRHLCWEDMQQHLCVGVQSIFLILKHFLPKMAQSPMEEKKVVFMLSSCVMGVPPVAMADYISAKYALLGLFRALASEYKKSNIQINAIAPSMIETGFLQHIDPKIIELNALNHPLKRNAKPQDITPMIKLLLSAKSHYIHGACIPLTGGEIF